MASIHIELSQETTGTAYQKLSYKIIEELVKNPKPHFIFIELKGFEFRTNRLTTRRIIQQLEWFREQGYRVNLNGIAI